MVPCVWHLACLVSVVGVVEFSQTFNKYLLFQPCNTSHTHTNLFAQCQPESTPTAEMPQQPSCNPLARHVLFRQVSGKNVLRTKLKPTGTPPTSNAAPRLRSRLISLLAHTMA